MRVSFRLLRLRQSPLFGSCLCLVYTLSVKVQVPKVQFLIQDLPYTTSVSNTGVEIVDRLLVKTATSRNLSLPAYSDHGTRSAHS
jgi:hypothetical protein